MQSETERERERKEQVIIEANPEVAASETKSPSSLLPRLDMLAAETAPNSHSHTHTHTCTQQHPHPHPCAVHYVQWARHKK